jgi:hypothetical protein
MEKKRAGEGQPCSDFTGLLTIINNRLDSDIPFAFPPVAEVHQRLVEIVGVRVMARARETSRSRTCSCSGSGS